MDFIKKKKLKKSPKSYHRRVWHERKLVTPSLSSLVCKASLCQATIVKDRTNHTMCAGPKRWTSWSCVNHKVKREREKREQVMNLTFTNGGCADEALRNASLNGSHFSILLSRRCFPWILHLWTLHLWDSFKSGLITPFPLCLSLSLSLSYSHFLFRAHTFLSITNEPAVKLMFCNHPANCRYPLSALTAANALDLSLGVHLKNLRESWTQWSERGGEKALPSAATTVHPSRKDFNYLVILH